MSNVINIDKHILERMTTKELKDLLNKTIMIYLNTGEGKELYDRLWNVFYDDNNNRRVS